MLDKLEADREMEASEKLKLEQEIAEKQVNPWTWQNYVDL